LRLIFCTPGCDVVSVSGGWLPSVRYLLNITYSAEGNQYNSELRTLFRLMSTLLFSWTLKMVAMLPRTVTLYPNYIAHHLRRPYFS
jgi:hypothetical protein